MKKAVIGAVLGALSVAAQADSMIQGLMENLYGGVAFGLSHYGHGCQPNAFECKNTQNPGYKYWGGWKMSDRIAGEISYINFDRVKGTSGSGGQLSTRALRTDGFLFNLAFYQPISQDFTGVGRVGVARLHTSGTVSGFGIAGTREIRPSQGDTSPYVGAALNIDFRGLMSKFMPVNLDGFYVEIGVDVTRARFAGDEHTVRLWNVGGAFQF